LVGPAADQICAGISVQKLDDDFPNVFSQQKVIPEAHHGIEHRILTTGRPVAACYRLLDSAKLKAARDKFSAWSGRGL
jgi:hypothetical protein